MPDHIYLIAEYVPTFRGAPEMLVPLAFSLTEAGAERYVEQIEDDRTAARTRIIKVPRTPPPERIEIVVISSRPLTPPAPPARRHEDDCPF